MAAPNRANGSSIIAPAMLIAALSFASRLLGLFRDRVLAGEFGAGEVLDAYAAAFRIPDFVFNLLGLAAFTAAFLPVFVRIRAEDRDAAMAYAARVLRLVAIALGLLCALGAAFAPLLFRLLLPGFPPAQLALTVEFSRVLFLATFLLGLSAVAGGILQAEQRFFVFAAAPLTYNIGIIGGTLLLVPVIGPIGIAWGAGIGAGLHLLAQCAAAVESGFRLQWLPAWRDTLVRDTARLLVPRVLGLASDQVQLVVIAGIASTLAAGSLAAFTFAGNIAMVPVALVGIAFAVAAFPRLADAAAAGDRDRFRERIATTMREILLLAFPAVVLLTALRSQIVRVLLGSGAFDWEDTVVTFETLAAFAVGLLTTMLIPVLARAFYALEDTRTPLRIGLLANAVGIGGAFALGGRFGAPGLALAVSLASVAQATLLLLALRRRIGGIDLGTTAHAVWKFGVAAFVMGEVIQVVKPLTAAWVWTHTFVGIALQGVLAGALGCAAYLAVGILLRSPEITALAATLRAHAVRLARLPLGGADEARG